jgi:hypothetical protein
MPPTGYPVWMGMGEVRITWSRAEVRAVREAVELTPNFEGRLGVRDVIRTAVRTRKTEVVIEREVAERFARRLVATDLPTALAKVKLLRAIRTADQQSRDEPAKGDVPAEAA